MDEFERQLLDDILDYYAHETDEWADPTGDLATYFADKTPPIIEVTNNNFVGGEL